MTSGDEVHKASKESEMNTDKETDFYEEPCKFPKVNASQAAFRSLLSDQTQIMNTTWAKLKSNAMKEDYKESTWFVSKF